MREKVLGLPVDVLTKKQTLEKIEDWIKLDIKGPKQVLTAYSEFYVNARRDKDFARIISKADLVTADGRSVLAAVEYMKRTQELKNSRTQGVVRFLWEGMKVGWKILGNDLGETVTGVWLFEEICKVAEIRGWKVFVLGGWGDVNERATKILLKRFPRLRLASDPGEKTVGKIDGENKRVLEKINKFKPDVLFVQYRPVQQEKWIDTNRKFLKVKVAVGIGGTLDEFVGDLKRPPL
ncbi:hypothetical protein A2572_00695, partial [Candidatus Collierbacteria bacterium RIFOXYD1_FULL_40_9]